MTTCLYHHTAFLQHDTGPGHPERADRLRAVSAALAGDGFETLERLEAPLGRVEDIHRVHPPAYVNAILSSIPKTGGTVSLDADTVVSAGSEEAALRAVGATCAAVDRVMAGKARNAFCAVRPPGHHAEPDRVMGFCLFNNAAIAARRAQVVHGAKRIAVVDFDVHHGNGTQAAFWDDADAFYASSHQYPAYPGTGGPEETGAHGNIVNVGLAPGARSVSFRAAYEDVILPSLKDFKPDFLVMSAGFDAHERDPLANISLTDEDFGWVTEQLCRVAAETCAGRVVSVLEGGYDLQGLGTSVAAHVRALMQA